MNSMRNEAGVYALVMKLESEQTIVIDRKGTQHTFAPGHYIYGGSARGPGGLRSRVNRHRKQRDDGKRMHWNVDYFREHCERRLKMLALGRLKRLAPDVVLLL